MLVALALVLVGGTAAYLVGSRDARLTAARAAPAQATTALADVESGPWIVLRITAIGPDHGRVATGAAPSRPRTATTGA